MGLFDTSLVNSKNVNNYSSAITNQTLLNNQKTVSTTDANAIAGNTFTGLESSVAQLPKAITQGVTTATSQASGIVNGVSNEVTGAVSSAVGLVSSGVSSLTGFISDAESSLSKVFGSTVTGLSNAFDSLTNTSLANTALNNTTAGNVKTAIPDPIKSSFAAGTPNAQLFKTTNASTGMVPQSLSSSTNSTGGTDLLASKLNLVSKYGSDLVGDSVSSIRGAVNTVTQSSAVQGLFSGIRTVTGTATSIVSSAQSAVGTITSSASTLYTGGLSEYQNLTAGLSRDITDSPGSFLGNYNASLPSAASATGTAVSGVPLSTNPTTLTSLYNATNKLGCNLTIPSITSYSAIQSALSLLMSLASNLGITQLLSDIMGCSTIFGSYGTGVAKSLFYQYAGSNANVSNTILNAIGSQNLSGSPSLAKTIVTNPSLTSSDTATVNNLFSKLGMSSNDAFTVTTNPSNYPVWDISTLSSTNNGLGKSLVDTSNQDIFDMLGGSEVSF